MFGFERKPLFHMVRKGSFCFITTLEAAAHHNQVGIVEKSLELNQPVDEVEAVTPQGVLLLSRPLRMQCPLEGNDELEMLAEVLRTSNPVRCSRRWRCD